MMVFKPSLPPISSSTTSVRFGLAAATDSSNILEPSTAHRGTIAETVTNPVERIRKSRREKAMSSSSGLGGMERGAGQHDVGEAPALLVPVAGRVGPRAGRPIVVSVHVVDPSGADRRRDVVDVQPAGENVHDLLRGRGVVAGQQRARMEAGSGGAAIGSQGVGVEGAGE